MATTLLGLLAGTRSPDVRAKAAMHLDAFLQQRGACMVSVGRRRPRCWSARGSTDGAMPIASPRCSQLSSTAGPALAPRLLRAAAGLMDEGRLEARTAGKRMLWQLRRLLDGGAAGVGNFRRTLARLDINADRVRDVADAPCMPPLAPARQPSGTAAGEMASPSLGGQPQLYASRPSSSSTPLPIAGFAAPPPRGAGPPATSDGSTTRCSMPGVAGLPRQPGSQAKSASGETRPASSKHASGGGFGPGEHRPRPASLGRGLGSAGGGVW